MLRLPDDLLDEIAKHLSVADLGALSETSTASQAIVLACLDRRYGRLYDEYCRCTKYAPRKTHKTLLRFAAPMTMQPWTYRCAGCGRRLSTLGSCPVCAMRRLSRERDAVQRQEEQRKLTELSVVGAAFSLVYSAMSESQSLLVYLSGVLSGMLLLFGLVDCALALRAPPGSAFLFF